MERAGGDYRWGVRKIPMLVWGNGGTPPGAAVGFTRRARTTARVRGTALDVAFGFSTTERGSGRAITRKGPDGFGRAERSLRHTLNNFEVVDGYQG